MYHKEIFLNFTFADVEGANNIKEIMRKFRVVEKFDVIIRSGKRNDVSYDMYHALIDSMMNISIFFFAYSRRRYV